MAWSFCTYGWDHRGEVTTGLVGPGGAGEGWGGSPRCPHLLLRLEVAEVLEELGFRRELGGLQEVQEAEELLHRVLQRGARQEDLVFLRTRGCRRLGVAGGQAREAAEQLQMEPRPHMHLQKPLAEVQDRPKHLQNISRWNQDPKFTFRTTHWGMKQAQTSPEHLQVEPRPHMHLQKPLAEV